MIKLSRTKLELLFDCPRCFWFYAGKGIARPFGAPYTINNAIDFLLKKEFEEKIFEAKKILDKKKPPEPSYECIYCKYNKDTSILG